MNKQELEERIALGKRTISQIIRSVAEDEAQLAALNNPSIVGHPFVKGVNEPNEGQFIWYTDFRGEIEQMSFTREYQSALRRGEFYPTRIDCYEGSRREEIRKRYEAMGRAFMDQSKDWEPYENWMAAWDYNCHSILTFDAGQRILTGSVCFATEESCRAAIDTINREYGPGAFEWAMFGIPRKE